MSDVEAALSASRFTFARDAADEARKRRTQKQIGSMGALLIFGPLLMVNLGGDHSFVHMHEPAYWLASCVTLIGAFMVAIGMRRLVRNFEQQKEEIQNLKGTVERMQAEFHPKA